MKIKNGLIMKDDFSKVFSRLLSFPMSVKQCLAISLCIDTITSNYQTIARARKSILEKYYKKDETGKPITTNDGNLTFENEAIRDQCFKDINELFNEEIEIPLKEKIKIKEDVEMTPIEFDYIKDLIEIVE